MSDWVVGLERMDFGKATASLQTQCSESEKQSEVDHIQDAE